MHVGNGVWRMRTWRTLLWRAALAGGALVVTLVAPPVVGYTPRLALGLLAVALGAAALLIPVPGWPATSLRTAGAIALWLVIAWCVLSQVAPLTQPLTVIWPLRLLPILLVAAIWLWPQLSRAWQRRLLLALLAPSYAGLLLTAWASPATPLNFKPEYVAVASTGTLYVTDVRSPVIRVFAPNGTLTAKLRPGLASRLGPPGPGFGPPGPFNDPERLGIYGTPTPVRGGPVLPAGQAQPGGITARDPFGDEFRFCGLAIDAHDRLYVPDIVRSRMLRFLPDGRLDARWPIPTAAKSSRNCVAVSGDSVYYASQFGQVWHFDTEGHLLATKQIPGLIVAGLAADPGGDTVYILSLTALYTVNPHSDAITPASLSTARALRASEYTAMLAYPDHRLLLANVRSQRADLFCPDAGLCGAIGTQGNQPGQFEQMSALARDAHANVYIADISHRVVQRFDASGRVTAVYWGPDDDESE